MDMYPNELEEVFIMSKIQQRDVEKERFWQKVIGEAARSGVSIREFCRSRKLKESQFYWWQRVLKQRREERTRHQKCKNKGRGRDGQVSFALVSEDGSAMEAGIELVLGHGLRVRISKGVDAETLRTVLSAVERERC
jgi:hypothetical protein